MNVRRILQRIKLEVAFYRDVLADERTPACSRWLLLAALAYLASPIDLIPDFIPLIGQLDDLIIVGGLILIARALIPKSVICQHRQSHQATLVTLSIDDDD